MVFSTTFIPVIYIALLEAADRHLLELSVVPRFSGAAHLASNAAIDVFMRQLACSEWVLRVQSIFT